MYKYTHETVVDAGIDSTFEWFEHEGSFRRLMPPWEVAEEVRADDSLEVGSQRVFPVSYTHLTLPTICSV